MLMERREERTGVRGHQKNCLIERFSDSVRLLIVRGRCDL